MERDVSPYNNNNNTPIINNNNPHNYHSQYYSHNQNTGKKGMRSTDTPRHNNLDSINKKLQNEVRKKEREIK